MRDPLNARQIIENRTLTEPMLELLSAMVKGRLNILVSGGAGTGKTTFLNILSGYIPNSERIVTIESEAESRLHLHQEHVVRLIARPPDDEGKGAIPQRQLVINSLRMRPNRIVVGEVRGDEAFEIVQAMIAGNVGLFSINANSPIDALSRLENMASLTKLNIEPDLFRRQVASVIHCVVHLDQPPDGTHKVMSISEVSGMERGFICLEDLFLFEPNVPDELGLIRGAFHSTGIGSRFVGHLLNSGHITSSRSFKGVGSRVAENFLGEPGPYERSANLQIKADLHRKILDKMDLEKLGRTNDDTAREEVLALIRSLVSAEAVPLSFAEREQLARTTLDEMFGLGPLEPLLKDPTVSDILVNRFDRVYVERDGKLERTSFFFKDNAHLMQIIDRIISRVGRRLDASPPMLDVRLGDGSHLIAVIPPLAADGPYLSIRRFGREQPAPGLAINGGREVFGRNMQGIRVAILSQDGDRLNGIQAAIARTNLADVVYSHLGFPQATGDPIIGEILDRRPEIVIVELDPKNLQQSIQTIELFGATTRGLAVFACGEMQNPMNIVAAMRAGAVEYVDRDLDPHDLSEALNRFTAARTRTRDNPGRARVFTFVNAKGGAGATTIAVHTALALQRNHGQTVLVDFAPLGHAAMYLSLRPSSGVIEALQNLHRMDDSLLAGLMIPTKEGLHVLAGSQKPDQAIPTEAELARLFGLLVKRYSYVIVDCSGRVDAATRLLSELSSAVLIVSQTDVTSLWSANRIRSLLEANTRSRFHLILNRYRKIPGFADEDVETAANLKILCKVPNDFQLIGPAIDKGEPVAADSEVGRSLQSLADLLAEGDDLDAAQGSMPSGGWTPPRGSSGGGSAPPAVPLLVPHGPGPRPMPPGKVDKIQKKA